MDRIEYTWILYNREKIGVNLGCQHETHLFVHLVGGEMMRKKRIVILTIYKFYFLRVHVDQV